MISNYDQTNYAILTNSIIAFPKLNHPCLKKLVRLSHGLHIKSLCNRASPTSSTNGANNSIRMPALTT
jgi:hypothetical protein